MSVCLQLDVGNSSAKWRLMDGGRVTGRGRYVAADDASRRELLACTGQLDQIWVSSVAGETAETELRALLAQGWPVTPWFARTQSETCGLRNSYRDPGRMGVDRWLAMLGARARCAGRLCVVDAGSALTIDLVDPRGQHEGGYIIPGPQLMERALLLDTDRVRFDEQVGYALSPGTSTAEAVRHGIALAQAGAVNLALARVAGEIPALLVCGGAGETLLQLLDYRGEYAPDLVFEGLEVMAAARY